MQPPYVGFAIEPAAISLGRDRWATARFS